MMERISAACAMEWSIELEKGLRSKKPGQPIEAILQIGPRLEQWSKEPIYTMAVLSMFGLVPGEDRLFANTILLRLADAFRTGNNHTRLCVLKVFLFELRHCRKNGKRCKGILAKERVPNYPELLKRVKIVFDTGDVESRALALCLLGCWADIAKDSAEIRYMIFSSLGSCHVLEVRASLFAAGCFSELSEDFASVFLEILINMVSSSKPSLIVKLAGARAFAKIGCSSILATRAYKTGKKLVLGSYQEEFIIEMLMPLSKLASKSMLLISEQVDLLISFISCKSALCMQAMALRCFYFLSAGGVYRFSINASILTTLFHVLDNTNLPLVSQCDALRILLKIFQSTLPSLPCMDMSEFVKLVSLVESAAQSPIAQKRFLALRLLVDISRNHRMATEMASHVILLLLEQIALVVKPTVLKPSRSASDVIQECKILLNLVLCMVEEYSTLGVLALDKIRFSIEFLVDVCKGSMETRNSGSSSFYETLVLEDKKRSPIAKLVFCMYRFLESCIETLDEANAITSQIHHSVKLVVEIIHTNSLFNHDMCAIYSLLLHSRVMWRETCNVDTCLDISHCDYWTEQERVTLEFTKKMMEKRENWAAYRVGKWAACHGAWFVAEFTFRELLNKVQSEVCQCWLKSLALFARAESTILLLLFPEQGHELLNRLQIHKIWATCFGEDLGEIGHSVAWNTDLCNYGERFNEAYRDVCSAVDMLSAAVTTDRTFIFQRRFLVLRANILEIVVDILRLLNTNPCNKGNIGINGQVEESTGSVQNVHSLAYFLTQISFRLKRLVHEFDLLATSLMGVDTKSFKTISRLALNCSLLAFTTGFALYFPNLHSYEKYMYWGTENVKFSHSILIQDIAERLWYIDSETSSNLKQLLILIGVTNNCFYLPPRALIYRAGCRERETLDVCRLVVSGVFRMQEEAKIMNNDGVILRESRARLQFLSDVLKKWMNLSFHAPKHFFHVRPCIGAELFAFNADTRNPNELSIFSGFQLSLNLCLQLKNVPSLLSVRITKFYCILAAAKSSGLGGERIEQMQSGFETWTTDDTLNLSEKLLFYVSNGDEKTSRENGRASDGDGYVWSCIGFEPNEKMQGFSPCLLDVSAFPMGSYKIKWHCCCIDSQGSYWNLVSLNRGPVFSVK